MTSWPATVLAEIDRADDLKVSPLRADGVTHGTPTWIWCVVVDGDLYVRGYHGRSSRWYASVVRRRDGPTARPHHAAGQVFEVVFESAPDELADAIDAAYRAKYARSPYLSPMIGAGARAAGVRIRPVPRTEP